MEISNVGNTNLWCCMSMKGQEANYKGHGDGNSSWSHSIKSCRESPLLQIPQRPNKQSQAINHHRQHHRHRKGRRDGVMETTVIFHGFFTKRLNKAAASALLPIFTCATILLFGSIWLIEQWSSIQSISLQDTWFLIARNEKKKNYINWDC